MVAVFHHYTELTLGVLEVVQVSDNEFVVQLVENQSLLLGHLSIGHILQSLDSDLFSFLGVLLFFSYGTEVNTAKSPRAEGSDFPEVTISGLVVKSQSR